MKTQDLRAAGALECGSLLPLSSRELARGLMRLKKSATARTASKLAWRKR